MHDLRSTHLYTKSSCSSSMLLRQLFLSRKIKRTDTLLISKSRDDPVIFRWFFQFNTFYTCCFVQIKTLRAFNGSKYYVCAKMIVVIVMSLPLFLLKHVQNTRLPCSNIKIWRFLSCLSFLFLRLRRRYSVNLKIAVWCRHGSAVPFVHYA